MKAALTLILALTTIFHSFAQKATELDTPVIGRVTNQDSILIRYFEQLNPNHKKIRLSDAEVKAHLNAFFIRISDLINEDNKKASALKITQAKVEKLKADSVEQYSFYKRTDTLVFKDYNDIKLKDDESRNKAKAIKFTNELIKLNSLAERVSSIDINDMNSRIDVFEKSTVDWSATQKEFIAKTVRIAKYNLSYLDIVSDKYYRLLNEKKITPADLNKLRLTNEKPIQQKFLSEIMAKLGWQ